MRPLVLARGGIVRTRASADHNRGCSKRCRGANAGKRTAQDDPPDRRPDRLVSNIGRIWRPQGKLSGPKWRGARRVSPNPSWCRHQPACKPGSVGYRPLARTIRDGHSSGTTLARSLEQPTRTASLTSLPRCYRMREPSALPSLFGLAPGVVCHASSVAEAAVRSYRTFSPLLPATVSLSPRGRAGKREAVRSLWHCPWGCPRRRLSGTACRWSPDFPLPRPFGWCGSGRPAD